MAAPGAPRLSVVVPSRDRPLRLRWLLNALEEQDATGAFEVIVAHNSSGTETDELLAGHPLRPRALRLPGGLGPAALRNAGWRAARAPVVAFTDDDCRPPAGWVASALRAAAEHPGAIVQGRTEPDPDELPILHHAPHARSQHIVPPVDWAQTCNIVYPRAVLERVGGFDESFPQAVGEDTDLALRARAAGVTYAGDPALLTYHAVDWGLRRRLRGSWRWQHMALLVRRHPALRRHFPLRVFWKPAHLRLCLAGAGLATRRPWLVLPYLLGTPLPYGRTPRGVLRALSETPGRALIDATEVAALARGSIRHRSLVL